jgi:hypothetical protein
MFEDPPQPPVAPILTDTTGGWGKAAYTRYRPKKPVRCDDCAAAFIQDKNAPHSRPAAYRRKQEGTDDLLLCYEHKAMREGREAGAAK